MSQTSVLIADDDAAMRGLLSEALSSRFGCQVHTALDGDEALDYLRRMHFSVFVTDMLMPGLHGLTLIKRCLDLQPDLDVLVMTGFSEDFPFVDVIDSGATDFIVKPFQLNELVAKLKRVFKEREDRLARVLAESKFQSVFELSIDGMLLVDREHLRILDVNRAFEEIAGISREKLVQQPFFDRVAATDLERFKLGLSICRGRGTIGDVGLIRSDGTEACVDLSITFIDVASEHLIFLALKDVTEKREVERQLAQAAITDTLSGLLNKHAFQRNIEAAVRRARHDRLPLTLLMLDLDDFKHCNDNHGHQVGDALLHNVGQLIAANIRGLAGDEGFRCGGDEFAVILHNMDQQGGLHIAERLRARFNEIQTYGTSLSVGVAEYHPPSDATELVRAADKALYAAKACGKNTVSIA